MRYFPCLRCGLVPNVQLHNAQVCVPKPELGNEGTIHCIAFAASHAFSTRIMLPDMIL